MKNDVFGSNYGSISWILEPLDHGNVCISKGVTTVLQNHNFAKRLENGAYSGSTEVMKIY